MIGAAAKSHRVKEAYAMTGHVGIPKCPTGVSGLDDITGGGLPAGRPTLICGGAGR